MSTTDRLGEAIPDRVEGLIELVTRPYRVIRGNRGGEIGLVLLLLMVSIGIAGPMIAPYGALEKDTNEIGFPASMEGPSAEHPFGTTRYGRDILSQTLIGARSALLIGFSTATIVVLLGTFVGVVSGYFGGRVDETLMRITDIVYGIPILPFAIVALTILERSMWWIVLVIGLLYWRNSARIIRSDVLSLRDEEFIQKAKTTGASDRRILRKQVVPNVLPISFLYFAFATGFAIIMSASIAFLGFGDPNRISWGRMIFAAWNNNGVFQQPLWVAAPGLMIVLTVGSVYLIGQTYEEVANPRLKDR
jgi:peptide/nickel transport system permease protein